MTLRDPGLSSRSVSGLWDSSLDFLCYLPLDKTIIMWKLTRDETNYGIPQRALRGHSHFVSDVVISSDGQFALSGSWDGTLRLWDLTTQVAAHLTLGHWEKAGQK